MKKLFITCVLILIIIYPTGISDANPKRTVRDSIANYEKIKYGTVVDEFFRKAHEISKSLNKAEKNLK
jgi:hypothetical protein